MPYIDEHALVGEGATLGEGVKVWAFSQVRDGAHVGEDTTIGSHSYVDTGVMIGKKCKIQTGVYIFNGVTIEDGVFIGPGVVLTNDLRPRSTTPDGDLKESNDWGVTPTSVRRGASLGAGAVIVAGADIGEYAFVGAAAVVTRPVLSHALVVGSPAKQIGWVCFCGAPWNSEVPDVACATCGEHVDLGERT